MDPAATAVDALPAVKRRRSLVKRGLMYAFAAACLLWVFHDIDLRQLLIAMRVTNWWFVALAVTVDVLTYVLQGVRWKVLLEPVGRLGSVRATQAIYAGLFTNELVPLRVGELVRGLLVSRWLRSGISAVLPSMAVERLLDALWLAVGVGVAAIFVPLPKNLLRAGDVLGIIVLAATAVFLWLVFRTEKALERGPTPPRAPEHIVGTISAVVFRFSRGLCEIGISSRLYVAAALSAGMLACQTLAVWFMMLACGIHLPLSAGAVVFLVVRLGTAIPNAPANVGSFQFFTVVALGLFGVDKTVAAAFSVVDFAALTAPLWLIGLFAIARTGMSLASIRSEVGSLRPQ